jgi:hypothetical protein
MSLARTLAVAARENVLLQNGETCVAGEMKPGSESTGLFADGGL